MTNKKENSTKQIIENRVNFGEVVCIDDLKGEEEFGGIGKAEFTIDYQVRRILKEHEDWRKYKIMERTYLTTWKTWYEIKCGLDNLLGKLYPVEPENIEDEAKLKNTEELKGIEDEIVQNEPIDKPLNEPLNDSLDTKSTEDELSELKRRKDINGREEEDELFDYGEGEEIE